MAGNEEMSERDSICNADEDVEETELIPAETGSGGRVAAREFKLAKASDVQAEFEGNSAIRLSTWK